MRRRRTSAPPALLLTVAAASAFAGMLVGGLALFLFDPRNGRRRRALARDRVVHLSHASLRRTRLATRRLRAGSAAARRRAVHAVAHRESSVPDDRTLLDRVESVVFRSSSIPKGAVNLTVFEGVAILRGALEDPDEIAAFERRVRDVPGVRGVNNLLHLAGTDAPNKHDAIVASHLAVNDRLLPHR
ncbi:MAG: BON domain-containing protein [Dehalococcoidia bacterium]|nr:BON domain-containing protein [Dehalococcoidia bacterium]